METKNTQQESPKVILCRARLQAAELRVRAAHQQDGAAAHFRQATHPIYEGQEEICAGKGNVIAGLAAQTRAQADLIEAEAEAAYKAATGQEAPHA